MITTLTGDNSFLLTNKLKELTQAFTQEHGDFAVERLDASSAEYTRIQEAVAAMPFLASKRLVIIDGVAGNKELSEHINTFLDSVNDQTEVLLVEPKFDKRSSLYKTLKKSTEFFECSELDESGLSRWLMETAKADGGEISSSDARYLVQRTGINQQKLSMELAKLLSYQPKVTRATIDLLTEKTIQSTVFELIDAAFRGNKKRALELYEEQRKLKVEPQAILALLGWQLHVLAVVKVAKGKSAQEIASESKLNPYVVRKSGGLMQNVSLAQLKANIERTLELDVRLKSEGLDADEALKNLLIQL